jgi:hypothetical protein
VCPVAGPRAAGPRQRKKEKFTALLHHVSVEALSVAFCAGVADCPLWLTSPNAPSKRDLLDTVLLSGLAGHWRYAHIISLRCDQVNPSLLGMNKVLGEDAVRRNLEKIDETKGLAWLQAHVDDTTTPLLGEPWVLDMDSTVKTLGRCRTRLQSAQARPSVALLSHRHAVEPAVGAAGRCVAR